MTQLYKLQEKIWRHIFDHEDQLGISNTLLCGGTALARFYLNHRVSYDLDFFVPSAFNPEELRSQLKKIGLELQDAHLEGGGQYCKQLKGIIRYGQQAVKVDFIEDIYEGMFDTVTKEGARTESIDGLYHRKIRTVSGMFLKDGSIKDGRQTARDIFDLYVLGQSIESLNSFIDRINNHGANIPIDGTIKGILTMPWIELLDEFSELDRLDLWKMCELRDVKIYLGRELTELQKLKDVEDSHESTFTS
jgi:hypothetical protein